MSSVKVGSKGQIVIPKEAREIFGIRPGDTLLLLADEAQGIALQRFDHQLAFFEQVFRLSGAQVVRTDDDSDEGASD